MRQAEQEGGEAVSEWDLILRTKCGASSVVTWHGKRPPESYVVPLPPDRHEWMHGPDNLTGLVEVRSRRFEIETMAQVDTYRAVAWYREVFR
jgi:hypothetical protein